MKTFTVTTAEGKPLQAEQHATFAYYVQGEQFRFVVTQLPGDDCAVTHRASGKRVSPLVAFHIIAARHDYAVAGRAALDRLIAKHGAPRVRSVLAAAE